MWPSLLAAYDYEEEARRRAQAEKRARALVREHWPLICRVADALVECGRLSYGEFLVIVDAVEGSALNRPEG